MAQSPAPSADTAGADRPLTLFFSVGEPSGDLHAANLIRQLRARCPDLRAVGYGGPSMQAAGCQLHEDLTALAVMWVWHVLRHVHRFLRLIRRADHYFDHQRPDAVILVDYPGFNWWIARRAKRYGIPVFYYTPPQVWAWARWRVKKMRRLVDHVLCALPFEAEWFRRHGCRATFIGHPFFDEVRRHRHDAAFVDEQRRRGGRLVTILPGSRTQEVRGNLRFLLQAAGRIHQHQPGVRFAVACFRPQHAEFARQAAAETRLPIEIHCGQTPELIALADCCMAVSGSVSLELLYHAKPTVIVYWVTRFAYGVQSMLRKVRYITLVNLLASDDPFRPPSATDADDPQVLYPEYLTWRNPSVPMADHVINWLRDEQARGELIARLQRLRDQVGQEGASARAAEYILQALAPPHRGGPPVPPPHVLAPRPAPYSDKNLR